MPDAWVCWSSSRRWAGVGRGGIGWGIGVGCGRHFRGGGGGADTSGISCLLWVRGVGEKCLWLRHWVNRGHEVNRGAHVRVLWGPVRMHDSSVRLLIGRMSASSIAERITDCVHVFGKSAFYHGRTETGKRLKKWLTNLNVFFSPVFCVLLSVCLCLHAFVCIFLFFFVPLLLLHRCFSVSPSLSLSVCLLACLFFLSVCRLCLCLSICLSLMYNTFLLETS